MVVINKSLSLLTVSQSLLRLQSLTDNFVKDKSYKNKAIDPSIDKFMGSNGLLVAEGDAEPPVSIPESLKAILAKNPGIKIQKTNQDGAISLTYNGEPANGYFDGYGIRFSDGSGEFSNYATSDGIIKVLNYKQQLDFILIKSFQNKAIVSSSRKNLENRFKEDLGGFVPTEWLFDPENKRYIIQVHNKDKGIIGRVYFDEDGNRLKEEDYNYRLGEKVVDPTRIRTILQSNPEIKIEKINQDGVISLTCNGESANGCFDGYGIRFSDGNSEFSNYATSDGIIKVLNYKQQLDFILIKSFQNKEAISTACEHLKDRFKQDLGFVPIEWLFDPKNKQFIVQVHSRDKGIIARVYFDENGNKLKEEDYNYQLEQKKKIVYQEIINDKAGKPIYRVIYDQNQKPLKILMYDSEGKSFDPINDPIEDVKKKINNKTIYDAFEGKYFLNIQGELFYSTNNWERLLELRNHGKKIYGLPMIIEKIEKRNRLTIHTEPSDGRSNEERRYEFYFSPLKKLEKDLERLDVMLQTYPPGFLGDKGGLKNISLVTFLTLKKGIKGAQVSGYFDVKKGDSVWFFHLDAKTVHHEIYHSFDYNLNGEGEDNNKKWEGLHPDGAKRYEFKDAMPMKDARETDHASIYGTFNPNEDQAETAGFLLTPADASILVRRAKNSKILQEKIRLTKDEYSEWIDEYCMNKGLMQDVLKKIEEGENITDDFWNNKGVIKGRTKDSPVEINLNPETPVIVNYYSDNVWIKIGKPYAVFYVESLPNGDFNWEKKFDFDGKLTNSPLFVANDGLFMWGVNYPITRTYNGRKGPYQVTNRSKNGAILICEPDNYGKVIGKIIFKFREK